MGEQLTMLDSMFLELEQADAGAHMHIGGALVFAPRPGGQGVPTLDEMTAFMEQRIGHLPRFTQRLSGPHAGPLRWLTWEDADELHLADHLSRATLPAPGGPAELHAWLADFWSHRLDRRRPLWEMVLLDGLEDGRWVLATKTHHCLVDGVGSIDIGHLLLDATPDGPGLPPAPAAERHDSHGGGRFWLSPGLVLRGARAGLGAALHPRDSVKGLAAAADLIVKDELLPAAKTSLNGETSGVRSLATVRVGLAEVKEIKTRLGGTVNDVVLAVCAGGLRHLLLSRGEEPPADGLRAQVPVNVRPDEKAHALGNEVTSLFVELPVAEADPLRRYRRVLERAEELKSGTQARGGRTIVGLAEHGPPLAGALLARSMFGGPRMFNLTITNVPGPQQRLYGFGSELEEVIPLVPLFQGHAVGIAVVSYAGRIVFGLNADRLGAPDVDVLAEGIERSLAELGPAGRPERETAGTAV